MRFIFLTDLFYEDYKHCTEIEQKHNRPYTLLYIQIYGTKFAVPLRSGIRHNHVLWTDKANNCGLDFSKAVPLLKDEYIDNSTKPYIRQNEFESLRGKEYIIKKKLIKYINDYKSAKLRLDIERNQTLCKYSALQYFENVI